MVSIETASTSNKFPSRALPKTLISFSARFSASVNAPFVAKTKTNLSFDDADILNVCNRSTKSFASDESRFVFPSIVSITFCASIKRVSLPAKAEPYLL